MRVGVVGAGISGLVVTHYLRQAGVETVTFEAAGEPGGVIRSVRRGGRVLERGPQRTRLTPSVRQLVDDLGLESDLVEAADAPLFVYRDGTLRRAPQSPRGAVTTSLFSWRGKLRALAEPLTGPPEDGETVAGYFRRSFGREVADNFLAPLYAGLYASDPEEMPVDHSAAKALQKTGPTDSVLVNVARKLLGDAEKPAIGSFEDGLQTLPEALYDANREAVRLEAPVRVAESDGDGYRLRTDGDAVTVDRLVVTTPAEAAAGLLASVAPDTARRLSRLTFNRMAVVHLHSDAGLHGSGFQVPHDEPFVTLGATYNDSLLDRDGVYTLYLGGAKNPQVVNWADDRLERTASEEFTTITGHDARPLAVSRLVPGMPAYDTSWAALEGLELPENVDLCTNYVSRAGIPGRVREAKQLAETIAETAGERTERRVAVPT